MLVDSSMKFSEHYNEVAKQANSILGLISRTINNKNKDAIIKLYKALVRPKLDYCVQVWSPYLKKDINRIEQIQHRATRMINGFWKFDYESRLDKCKLIALEDRRTRGDLIEVYKLINGIDKVDYRNFFELVNSDKTRGHRYKLVKKRCKLEVRRNFFSQRVISKWNGLPEHVVQAKSVNAFKNSYDDYFSKHIR